MEECFGVTIFTSDDAKCYYESAKDDCRTWCVSAIVALDNDPKPDPYIQKLSRKHPPIILLCADNTHPQPSDIYPFRYPPTYCKSPAEHRTTTNPKTPQT